jgi:hypothetical protein
MILKRMIDLDSPTSIVVVRVLTPCSLVDGYHRFGGTCFVHIVVAYDINFKRPESLKSNKVVP